VNDQDFCSSILAQEKQRTFSIAPWRNSWHSFPPFLLDVSVLGFWEAVRQIGLIAMSSSTTEAKVKATAEQAENSIFQNVKAWGGKYSSPCTQSSINFPTTPYISSYLVYEANCDSPESSLPPSLLATLIFPQHARPFQILPMLFPPVLLGTSYLNLAGYKTDAAGISAAWSGLYMLLASRRKHKVLQKFGTRGIIRGATLGLCAVNVVAGGVAYAFGRRGREETSIGRGA